MSTGGQVAGGLVGAVVGFFAGGGPTGALYGAQIGIMAGGYLDPPKGPTVNGPRLNDLTVQTSTYGAVIPRVYGTCTVNGNVIWLEGNALKETVTKKKSGGKGGGSKTTTRTYAYSASFAVGLCEGPIVGVRRIWVGPDLIYDAGSTDPDTIAASNAAAEGFAIYLGTNTQSPDPRIQADIGVANCPAWRGLAYIVFYDLALARYSNSLMGAQTRVEVVKAGAYDANGILVPFDTSTDDVLGHSSIVTGPLSVDSGQSVFGGACGRFDTLPADYSGVQYMAGGDDFDLSNHDFTVACWYWHASGGGAVAAEWGVHFRDGTNDKLFCGVELTGDYLLNPPKTSICFRNGYSDSAIQRGVDFYPALDTWYHLEWIRSGSSFMIFVNGNLVYTYNYGAITFPVTDNIYVAHYGAHWLVRTVLIDDLLVDIGWARHTADFDPPIAAYQPRIVPGTVSLSSIVSAECIASALLAAGDIDVTALTSQVRGYRIGSIGALRAAIEPLQAAWPFDVVQHGYKVKFVARGGASVVTVPAADLDARAGGSAPGVQITVGREMDSQLPRRVTVQHLDYDREYDAGTQYAERLNTAAINATVLDLPIVMTSAEAAGKAEVLLYLYWLERHDVTISLPPTYNQLEPGDVVTLTTPEGAVSLRLTGVTNTSDGRVECQAKYANPAIYTPAALGAYPAVTGITTVNPIGASVYQLLDVPYMSSVQSGPSFLAAMTGAKTGWRGGVLMRSADAGATWDNLQDFEPPGATIGSCTNSLGAVDSRMIDAGSVLSVTLTYGDLFSITQLAMLGGENHFAYGADGRWEIIAAQTCTLITGKSYTLQNMLRGRFGTEWAMSLHAAGDALVLLDPADVVAISVSSGAIGLSSLYRGITVDRDISTDSNRSFAYQAVNLKPLSPVSLSGNRDASNDWSLTWVRRTRTGGEWRDYVDAELGEASEQYQIDIFADGTYATVKRTISTTSQAATYSSANQVSDFGANQTTLYLKIYQVSATVGRGYPLQSSITR